jgi:small-conductance mechanosensitive channel
MGAIASRRLLVVLLAWLCCLPLGVRPAAAQAQPETNAEPATLVFWNRNVVELRATARGVSPAERVERALQRLEALPLSADAASIQVATATIGEMQGVAVVSGSTPLFLVLAGDVDPTSSATPQSVAEAAAGELRAALVARDRQRQPELLLKSSLLVLVATAVLVLGLWALGRLRQLALRGLRALEHRLARPLFGVDLGRHVTSLEVGLVRAIMLLAQLFAVYLWLVFVLGQFPYTEPWGGRLGQFLLGLFGTLGEAALNAIPGLFTVVVIFLLARYAARITTALFRRIEEGRSVVVWADAETAKATRRILVVLIWLFAIIVAYPYIPGSESAAFKGVSVFAGLMLTLGSAGFVGHVVSGFIVIYSRALKAGEMVRVGDTVGTVSEIGALNTRLVTARGEEVAIPNSVLVSSTVTNYSRRGGELGAVLCTTVSIGYDAPWRQVHALLLLAASRTSGLRKEPAPLVLQRALKDFYVEYELRVRLERTEEWFNVQSALNGEIQDAFNEYGVQIMSPHFRGQPEAPVVVPKERWRAAPAGE